MRLIFAIPFLLTLATACGESDDAQSGADKIPSGFGPLCDSISGNCETGDSPTQLAVLYNGTGTTTTTSNEYWAVGESEDFTATLDTSVEGKVSGLFDMGSFELNVVDANYSGSGNQFTIYGTDIIEDSGCDLEARVVITGSVDESTGALAGELALEFTDNITGEDCDADVIAEYPGTGAVFEYSASPNSD